MTRKTGKARAALNDLLERHDLDPAFSKPVMREVAQILDDPGIDDPGLVDMTGLPFITIDYAESRDLDQALHIEPGPGGAGFVVRYALADGAYYVRPGTALFEEALRRGVSYYLPGLVVPMLPPELSEGIVSLNPGQDRRALVFVMTLDDRGHAAGTEIVRARVHSRAKLTYDGVQQHHDLQASSPLRGKPYTETLDLLRAVGELRIDEARQRDVVHFDREEVEVELTADGASFLVRREPRNDSSRWNEQISLLCNIEGARFLARDGKTQPHVQPVFRVHEAPPPDSLEHLDRMIHGIIAVHELDASEISWRVRTRPRESLADYLERLRGTSVDHKIFQAIQRQALITNQRSRFSSKPGQHYALGVKPYGRFSSPMREVVGIFTHKEALEKLDLEPAGMAARDEQLREQVINAANGSKDRQRRLTRDVNQLAMEQLLQRDLQLPRGERPVHTGTILGLRPSRLYVQLDSPPLELKVYVEDLERATGSRYELQEDEVSLRAARGAQLRLGDKVSLTTDRYDRTHRRWSLVPADLVSSRKRSRSR